MYGIVVSMCSFSMPCSVLGQLYFSLGKRHGPSPFPLILISSYSVHCTILVAGMYVVAALGLLYAKPGQASKDPQLPPKEAKLLPQSILTESFPGSLCSTVLFRNKNFSLFSPKKYSLGWN